MVHYLRLLCMSCAALSLTACAPMLAMVGSSPTIVAVVTQVERVKLLGDGISYAKSSKTITDHALSAMTGSDCKLFNLVTGEAICATKTASAAAGAATNIRVALDAAPPAQTAPPAAGESVTPESLPAHDEAAGDE